MAALAAGEPGSYERFVAILLAAKVGLATRSVVTKHRSAGRFETGPEDQISLAIFAAPDGRRMLKACADPIVFARSYPETSIGIWMVGRELLEMVAENASLSGVLVCSATAFKSIPLGRDQISRMLGQT
jgi:hypothetical protein